MKKKIIVTAPTSALAKDYIDHVRNKYDIITVGRRESDIKYDFASQTELMLPKDAESIIHFAGVLKDTCYKSVTDMVDVNVKGVVNLCIAAKQSGIGQIINISSINATLKCESPYYGYYSLTKKQGEEIASLFCKKNEIKLCNIRPSQIFGVSKGYAKNQLLLYNMVYNAMQGKDIFIYGKKDAIRNYIFAENVFNIINASIENKSNGTIECIDAKNYKISEVAKIIIEIAGSGSKVIFLEEEKDLEDNGFYSCRNCFEELGTSFISFEDAIHIVMNTIRSCDSAK